ncbi:MAG: M56 family metallopeptidase [Planctomycetota bacterium]|jgi:bla regulator protein BlaR1
MNELINNMAGMWWAWMWPMLWQVSVLVGLIWVIDLIIRRRVWPQVRYALWLLVLVKLVLPPGLALSTSVTSGLGPLVKETVRSPIFAGDAGSLVKGEGIGPAAVGESPAIEPVVGSDVPTVVEPIIAVEEVSNAGVMLSWQAYAMLGWLAGAAVLAVWVAVRFWQLRGLHRGADEVELPERLGRLVQDTARKLKLRRVPKVVLSSIVTSPAVFGAFRPVLRVRPC